MMKLRDRILRKARREWNNLTRGGVVWTDFPRVIQVDTNNYCGPEYCGILCQYCYPQWKIVRGEREYREMPMEWIEWICKQMSMYGRNMSFVDWFLNGDGLTEPRLPEILRMSKKYCPRLYTQTFTNGVLTENVDYILSGNLDCVNFTISAHNRTLYHRIHGGDRFDDAVRTLKTVLERKPRDMRVEVHCVLTKDNYAYAKEWWEFFGQFEGAVRVMSPLVASYENRPSIMSMGDFKLRQFEQKIVEVTGDKGVFWNTANIPHRKPCNLWDNMSIDVEGYILQCCNWSPPTEVNYGTVQQYMDEGRTLKDAWMERLANRMRNKLCDTCNMKSYDWVERLNAMKVEARLD